MELKYKIIRKGIAELGRSMAIFNSSITICLGKLFLNETYDLLNSSIVERVRIDHLSYIIRFNHNLGQYMKDFSKILLDLQKC